MILKVVHLARLALAFLLQLLNTIQSLLQALFCLFDLRRLLFLYLRQDHVLGIVVKILVPL